MLPFSIALRAGTPIHEQVVYAVGAPSSPASCGPAIRFPSVRALSHGAQDQPQHGPQDRGTLTEEGLLAVRPGIGTVVAESRAGALGGPRQLSSRTPSGWWSKPGAPACR